MGIDQNKGYVRIPKNQNTNIIPGHDYIQECNSVLRYMLKRSNSDGGMVYFQDVSEELPLISDTVLEGVVFPKLNSHGFISILSDSQMLSSKTRIPFKLSAEGKAFLSEGYYAEHPKKTVKDFIRDFLEHLDRSGQTIDVTDFVVSYCKRNNLDNSAVKFKIDDLNNRRYIRCINHDFLNTFPKPFPLPHIICGIELEGEEYLRRLKDSSKDSFTTQSSGEGQLPL